MKYVWLKKANNGNVRSLVKTTRLLLVLDIGYFTACIDYDISSGLVQTSHFNLSKNVLFSIPSSLCIYLFPLFYKSITILAQKIPHRMEGFSKSINLCFRVKLHLCYKNEQEKD